MRPVSADPEHRSNALVCTGCASSASSRALPQRELLPPEIVKARQNRGKCRLTPAAVAEQRASTIRLERRAVCAMFTRKLTDRQQPPERRLSTHIAVAFWRKDDTLDACGSIAEGRVTTRTAT